MVIEFEIMKRTSSQNERTVQLLNEKTSELSMQVQAHYNEILQVVKNIYTVCFKFK